MTAVLHSLPQLITIEGGEGVGKSTAISNVVATLQAAGFDVVQTREPGGTHLGESLRQLLLEGASHIKIGDSAEVLMMFAARAQHMAEVIQPAMVAGKIVVCDRFTDSTYAYQCSGRGYPERPVNGLEYHFVRGKPGLTLLLDAPVEVCRARVAARAGSPDRIEKLNDEFFERVRRGFLQRAAVEPERMKVINTHQEFHRVLSDIEMVVSAYVAKTLRRAVSA